jgi:hypothetical protein
MNSEKAFRTSFRQPRKNSQSAFRLSPANLGEGLLALGTLALLIAVLLPWRYTQLNRASEAPLVVSGWQTGLAGGQGLCLLAIVVLLLLVVLRRLLTASQRARWEIVAAVVLGLATIVTFRDVLSFYSGPLVLSIKRSWLGAGFYMAMISLNLLIIACFLLLKQGQGTAVREPGEPR